jgi:hypothetical protein
MVIFHKRNEPNLAKLSMKVGFFFKIWFSIGDLHACMSKCDDLWQLPFKI